VPEAPNGKEHYIAARFERCGRRPGHDDPILPGWKATCLGDIAWIRIGKDGRLYAMNRRPVFGVAPGTSMESNPNAMLTIAKTQFSRMSF